MENKIKIVISDKQYVSYAATICGMIEDAASKRGTGIAKRTVAYISEKISSGKSVIALDGETLVGFCYIETWQHGKYVANSGLIVHPDYRGNKLAYRIKKKALQLSNHLFPTAKVFGITTSNAVLKINYKLGYQPVAFSELTTDSEFWKGCQGCVNYDILQRTKQKMCLCTGMMLDNSNQPKELTEKQFQKK